MMTGKKELFGEVAVRLRLASKQQVKSALKQQKELKEKRRKHRLIGLIMLDMDILDTTGLIIILKEINSADLN
ncbi:MAG: hypothetical protein AAB038_05630 [Planctomycetota bacterium]